LRRASRRDPVARLVLTTAGSSCGVDAHRDGEREQQGVDQRPPQQQADDDDENAEDKRYPQQQDRKAPQSGLEVRLGLPRSQACGNAPEFGARAGGDDHSRSFACLHDRAHERHAGQVA